MPKIAIVGCGRIGEEHTRCLASLGAPPQYFFDEVHASAKSLAQQYGGLAFATFEQLIEHPAVEAIYICTYHDTHAPFAIAAATNGKHIFLEKPMAIDEPACEAIRSAIQSSGVVCMTGFKFHYSSAIKQAATLISHPLALVANVFDTRWPDDSWANDPMRGGGNVLSQGCHAVELLMHLAHATPKSVVAMGGNLHHPNLQITDAIAGSITFDSGAIASLTVADTGATPHLGKFLVRMSDGIRSVEIWDRCKRLSYFDGETTTQFECEEDGFLNENRVFLEALRKHERPQTNEVTGIMAQRVLFRMLDSLNSQTVCNL